MEKADLSTLLRAVDPTQQQIKDFLAGSPAGQPVFMLNLLKFKDRATYRDGEDVSGRTAYERYATAFAEISKPYGAEFIYSGNINHMLIGEDVGDGALWDAVAVIKYPDAQIMVEAVSNEKYRAIYKHRKAGLAHQLLISCDDMPIFGQTG